MVEIYQEKLRLLMPQFKNISPQEITSFISFHRESEKHKLTFTDYTEGTMQYKQAEGAAYLFNLLNEKKLALLADEVGMGKTIQSLAVCSALWQQNPQARILVLAPRTEIAKNWIQEYETFLKVHYKVEDDIVKSHMDGEAINPAIYCENLYDLTSEIQQGWGKLFIGKISSFSNLLSKEEVDERITDLGITLDRTYQDDSTSKIEKVRGIAGLLKQNIRSHLPDGYFDLIIIDEAHYLRNTDGGSLKVNSAKIFFGSHVNRLAKGTLLLTATPNHSSSSNINAIVSYFDDGKYENWSYSDILNDICLRRFRRLSSRGKVKYNYRHEQGQPSTFDNDPMSELFFGIYQKQLVSEYMDQSVRSSRRNILGFLEGTEFIPTDNGSNSEDTELREGSDYSSGADGKILQELSAKYQRIFNGKAPSHPKYEQLCSDLMPTEQGLNYPNSKKLVFVRRIPSVREIAARVIIRYDELMLERINKAFKSDIRLLSNRQEFRFHFERATRVKDEDVNENGEEELDDNDTPDFDNVPTSKVLYLFKTLKKKKGQLSSTHASRFRLRFNRSKPSIFNVFFSPGADYFGADYQVHVLKSEYTGKGLIDDHFKTCLQYRVNASSSSQGEKVRILNTLAGSLEKTQESSETITITTLFGILWKHIDSEEKYSDVKQEVKDTYSNLDLFEKEALSNFIEKGILLASTALIDLYIAFIRASQKTKTNNVIELYQLFSKEVERALPSSALTDLIIESILNFKLLCEKVFNIKTKEDLLKEEWKYFWDAQPAYAYSGDTKNARVRSSFNTPFFPDILVSTSVLQEGVNLQFFCDKIIHYGVAWTPGDNEQRVGRIDRMFSKIEKNLEQDESSSLEIYYPYLKNTVDQDHVANFISKKHLEENLIDKCVAFSGSHILDPSNFNHENWQEFFRTQSSVELPDPYPVKFETLGPSNFFFQQKANSTNIQSQIINEFRNNQIPTYRSDLSSNTICVLDPKLDNDRSQPVFVQFNYDPELSGRLREIVYVLKLVTPIGEKRCIRRFEAKYSEFQQQYEADKLSVKLCLDRDQSAVSKFGVYARIDLIIFPNHQDNPLSAGELLHNYRDLIECADFMEHVVLNKDLALTDISPSQEHVETEGSSSLRKVLNSTSTHSDWKILGNYVHLENKYWKEINLRNIWALNHSNNYIKFLHNKWIVPYYKDDLQLSEIRALEEVNIVAGNQY